MGGGWKNERRDGREEGREGRKLNISLERGRSKENDTYKKCEMEQLGDCVPASDHGLSLNKTLNYAQCGNFAAMDNGDKIFRCTLGSQAKINTVISDSQL